VQKVNRYKVCVYAICKNEESFVDRWMDAVSEADQVVVVDTGSTDNTIKKLKQKGAAVYPEKIDPWRFDTARNIAMDHIPDDTDICVSNDLDEIFQPGWRKQLEAAWMPWHTRARYLFTWSVGSDGSPNKQFAMEKIHRRHGFRWVHPVHEVLAYTGEDPDNVVWVPGMVLNHYPDLSKPRSQYLPLLELSAQENPADDRTAFWLGREYMFNGMPGKAIAELSRHLSLPSASWDEERCASMRYIAKSHQSLGDFWQAKQWLYRAIAECPGIREPYLDMARLGYLEQNWPLVYLMVDRTLQITQKSGSYLMEPESWGATPYDLGAICTYRLDLFEQSLAFAKKACELSPADDRLKKNLELIEFKINENSAEQGNML
jgi:glycosyltransferase involved in cell wall biosynthesis